MLMVSKQKTSYNIWVIALPPEATKTSSYDNIPITPQIKEVLDPLLEVRDKQEPRRFVD